MLETLEALVGADIELDDVQHAHAILHLLTRLSDEAYERCWNSRVPCPGRYWIGQACNSKRPTWERNAVGPDKKQKICDSCFRYGPRP